MELKQKLRNLANEISNSLDATIQEKAEAKEKKRGPTDHSKANWASEVHHPCDRFLTYCRLHWPERKPKPIESLYRFEEGNIKEDFVEDRLKREGFRLILQEKRLTWDEYEISGRADGIMQFEGHELPVEIKSISPWFWDTTRTIQQITEHPKFWINKITSQLNLYELFHGQPAGFLVLATFGKAFRILPHLLDLELGEYDIQTCERVNAAVKRGDLLPPIKYASDVCGLCDFEHICQPVKFTEMTEATEDQARDVLRVLELEPLKREYDRLWKSLFGSKAEPGPFYKKQAFFEDVEVSFTETDQSYIELPETFKPRFTKKRKVVKPRISRTT